MAGVTASLGIFSSRALLTIDTLSGRSVDSVCCEMLRAGIPLVLELWARGDFACRKADGLRSAADKLRAAQLSQLCCAQYRDRLGRGGRVQLAARAASEMG